MARGLDELAGAGGQGTAPAAEARNTMRPLVSNISCSFRSNPDPAIVTAKEMDLQQQRRCLASQPGWQPPGGYLAICVVVKNQHADLGEWLDYHRRLGVSHVYVMDDHSDPPLDDVLAPFVQEGLVSHVRMGDYAALAQELREATCHAWHPAQRQLIMYTQCLRSYGARHQWMAFIDLDEFFVLGETETDADSLPTLLREFEHEGALAVNWRMFGSSGHKRRQNSTLQAYTRCFPAEKEVHMHIKSIVQPRYTARIATPHHALFAAGFHAVTTAHVRVDGHMVPGGTKPTYRRLALHHYAVKSAEEFAEKRARGNPLGDAPRDAEFWRSVEAQSVRTCHGGVKAWQRLYGRRPDGRS